jgi:hypothetical protein
MKKIYFFIIFIMNINLNSYTHISNYYHYKNHYPYHWDCNKCSYDPFSYKYNHFSYNFIDKTVLPIFIFFAMIGMIILDAYFNKYKKIHVYFKPFGNDIISDKISLNYKILNQIITIPYGEKNNKNLTINQDIQTKEFYLNNNVLEINNPIITEDEFKTICIYVSSDNVLHIEGNIKKS